MYDFNRDLIYFIKRDGTTENPYKTITENVIVLYEKVFLEEIPVQSFKVIVKVGTTNLTEVGRLEDVKSTNQYYVNYKQGIVYFHSSRNNVKVNLNYRGQGVLLYPASRIYVDSENGVKDVVKTLKELINEGSQALDAVMRVNEVISKSEKALVDMNTAILNAQNTIKIIDTKMIELNNSESNRVIKENERQTNESERQSAETLRKGAENQRISNAQSHATAESKRVTSENDRVNKENKRQTNESTRIQNEENRVLEESKRATAEESRIQNNNDIKTEENSRILSENTRKSNEDVRISNENNRISNYNEINKKEEIRISAEISRLDSEAKRVIAETDRVGKETQRQTNESTRTTNENKRLDSEAKRVIAETDRVQNSVLINTAEDARVLEENNRKENENTRAINESLRIANFNEINKKEDLRMSAEIARINAENIRVSNEDSRKLTFNSTILEFNNLKADIQKVTSDSIIATNNANNVIEEAELLISNTKYKDDFEIDRLYSINNIVSYNGSSYIAKTSTKGNIPTNSIYWGMLSQRGLDGKGSVVTVNGISPNLNGDVNITPEAIGAERYVNKGVANGYAGLDNNGKIPLNQVPDVLKQQTYVIWDEAERNTLTNLISGDKAYERSTGDSYIFDGERWQIMADADWENVSLDWVNIMNKPTSSVVDIDSAVIKSHTHSNKTVLDALNVVNSKLQYNSKNISAIDSVNGKTGAVTINASDVGAYEKSNTYSKIEIDAIISNYSAIEIIDSTPTTLDKNGILYIKKSIINADTPE